MADPKIEAAKLATQNLIGHRLALATGAATVFSLSGYLVEKGAFGLVEKNDIAAAFFGGSAAAFLLMTVVGAMMHRHAVHVAK